MRWATLAMTAATLGLAGCASRRVPMICPPHAVEVDTVVDLAASYPFDLPALGFSLVEPDGKTTAIVREFRPRTDGLTELVERDKTTGETLARVVLSRSASGDVVIHETATPDRNLVTRFDPPMLFLPAGLAPGESVEQTLRVETFTLADPPKPKGAGDGTLTITRAPDRAEAWNHARSWAVLEATLTAHIGPATVETVSVYQLEPMAGTAPGGLRGRSSTREVRVFGLAVERASEVLSGFHGSVNSPEKTESADTP